MVKIDKNDVPPTLAEVKAVDEAYPLYGVPELAPSIPLAEALANHGRRSVLLAGDLVRAAAATGVERAR